MFKNFLFITLKSVRHRPLRSWLTILGIIIGVMLVVAIFSLSSGIKNVVGNLMQQFGSDLIYVFPGKDNPFMAVAGGQRFREGDIAKLRNLEGVSSVMPVYFGVLGLEFMGEQKSTMIHGMAWREMKTFFEDSKGLRLGARGYWPDNEEAREIILGYSVAHKLFKNVVREGDDFMVKGRRFKVAGIFEATGMQEQDNEAFISQKNFQSLTSQVGVSTVAIKARQNADIDLLAAQIKFELSKQKVVKDFSVLTSAQANELVDKVLSVIELALAALAFISIVVGAVGIINTMYTSVLERTRQIGVMKAVGASNDAILSLFLIESGLIGAVGGILGILLGIFCSYLIGLAAANFGVSGLFSWAALDYLQFLVVLIITFIVGIVAGILPARQAAKLEAAQALKYE